MAAAPDGYSTWLQDQFGDLIDGLELSDLQRRYLRSRWLDQVAWMERKAGACQRRYYVVRLVTVIGAVVVPALVGLQGLKGDLSDVVTGLAIVISLVVAVAAAIEQFFQFGERWHHYRRTVEALKSEGWLFFELTGPYALGSHARAFDAFAARVEQIIASDVEAFVTRVTAERKANEP
ncbi:MAG: hypothetical protein QOG15_3812 [Solirubrobacteraceae bacterium]|jgi:hypothetical protein|nr:hypothetical protein [Solirubrobacteraceae bacterium]